MPKSLNLHQPTLLKGLERKDGIEIVGVKTYSVKLSSPCLHLLPEASLSVRGEEMSPKVLLSNISRRTGAIAAVASVLLAKEAIFSLESASGLDIRMAAAPERTIEEAETAIRGYAQSLLEIKAFLESESWVAAQKALRRTSSNLKKDMYTLIQNRPGTERPQLRKLYSNLFNNVSKLDYATRDKDAARVWQCYENIVATFSDILSRI